MGLHNPQPCNWPTAPAASSLFLMSVSLSDGILTEMVTADGTHDITPVENHPVLILSLSSLATYFVGYDLHYSVNIFEK